MKVTQACFRGRPSASCTATRSDRAPPWTSAKGATNISTTSASPAFLTLTIDLPAHHCSAPGNAATKRCHQNNIALFYAAGFYAFIQRNGNRSGRSVAMQGNIRVYATTFYVELTGN